MRPRFSLGKIFHNALLHAPFLNNVALPVLRSAKVACFVEVSKSADPKAKEFDSTLGEFPEKNILEERSLAVNGLLTKFVDESL